MTVAVVGLLDPGPQTGVDVVQGEVLEIDLGEELASHRAVPALKLALALGGIGPAIDEMDLKSGADALQRARAVGSPVISATPTCVGDPRGNKKSAPCPTFATADRSSAMANGFSAMSDRLYAMTNRPYAIA